VSFSPQLSTRRVVASVIVRGTDPTKPAAERAIEGRASWSEIGVDPNALGPFGLPGVETATAGREEVIDDAEVRTQAEATARAQAHLKTLADELVRATGSCVGMPEIRAGRFIDVAGLGERFSGKYRITQSTHSLGASGYTVSFQARKQVFG